MMISDFPPDLVEEILSRVPATSLKRLGSTCKRWNNVLFKDQSFITKHLDKAPKPPMVLLLKENRFFSVSVNLSVAPPPIKCKGGIGLKDSHSLSSQVDIAQVFHCDGLLLCTTKDYRLVVWNPCLGETKWIQLKTCYEKGSSFSLGYSNNKTYRSYKILNSWSDNELYNLDFGSEVYEFSTNSWKVINDVVRDWHTSLYGCVSLKGNTYWLAFDIFSDIHILSFDFTTESYRRVSLPPFQEGDWIGPSCVGEEQLSVFYWTSSTSKLEMWVASKIETSEATWSKYFTVDNHVFFVPTNSLYYEEKKVALCCEASSMVVYIMGNGKGYYKEISYTGSPDKAGWIVANPRDGRCISFIFSYVPSLVRI